MEQTILVIDDEEPLVRLLQRFLEGEGYRVVSASDGLEGLRLAQEECPDLIVLDLMLPRMDGWETCRRVRDCSDVPIIMLTAIGTNDDKVRGLDLGADDYLTKPFNLAEFAARVRAVLRRYRRPLIEKEMMRIDDHLTLDQARRRVIVDGRRIELSPLEYRILSCLLDNADCVLTHRSLLTQVCPFSAPFWDCTFHA